MYDVATAVLSTCFTKDGDVGKLDSKITKVYRGQFFEHIWKEAGSVVYRSIVEFLTNRCVCDSNSKGLH